jgi:hypothetical protein
MKLHELNDIEDADEPIIADLVRRRLDRGDTVWIDVVQAAAGILTRLGTEEAGYWEADVIPSDEEGFVGAAPGESLLLTKAELEMGQLKKHEGGWLFVIDHRRHRKVAEGDEEADHPLLWDIIQAKLNKGDKITFIKTRGKTEGTITSLEYVDKNDLPKNSSAKGSYFIVKFVFTKGWVGKDSLVIMTPEELKNSTLKKTEAGWVLSRW